MGRLEDRIKYEYQNMSLPDTDMASGVRARIENGSYQGSNNADKQASMAGRFVRRAVAAAVILLVLLGTSGTIYASVNGWTLGQMFFALWHGQVPEKIQDTISCDAVVLHEENSFDDIVVKPVKIIGDVRGLYVVLKVAANDMSYTEGFCDYSIEYDGSGSASYELTNLESGYMALEYIGGDDGTGVSESGKIAITLTDWCSNGAVIKGEYKALIAYDYESNDVVISKGECEYSISALTVTLSVDNAEDYYRIIEDTDSLGVKMKDGSVTGAEIEYGIESGEKYTIIFGMRSPIAPKEVVDIDLNESETE